MIKLSNEMLEKAKTAKTAEELIKLAKAEGVELSEEEAAKYFAELNKAGELSDEELDNVAGGCDDEIPEPKYQVGDLLDTPKGFPCPTCGVRRAFRVIEVHRSEVGDHTYTIACPECGTVFYPDINEHVQQMYKRA
ncbi:MAG: Nif11-like leader peptide family RiPP precursor [Candidatus Coproplasma sp.]